MQQASQQLGQKEFTHQALQCKVAIAEVMLFSGATGIWGEGARPWNSLLVFMQGVGCNFVHTSCGSQRRRLLVRGRQLAGIAHFHAVGVGCDAMCGGVRVQDSRRQQVRTGMPVQHAPAYKTTPW
jgi:hypothetical protein